MHDILILGAGPAGLSAAVAARQKNRGAGTDGNGACAAGSTEQSVGSGKGDGSRATEAAMPDVRVIATSRSSRGIHSMARTSSS